MNHGSEAFQGLKRNNNPTKNSILLRKNTQLYCLCYKASLAYRIWSFVRLNRRKCSVFVVAVVIIIVVVVVVVVVIVAVVAVVSF